MKTENSKMNNLRQHFFSVVCGLIAAFIPNNKSNIHPLLLGIIFALLFTKIVFGDYDVGYQWSRADFAFLGVVGFEGFVGAWIGSIVLKYIFGMKSR